MSEQRRLWTNEEEDKGKASIIVGKSKGEKGKGHAMTKLVLPKRHPHRPKGSEYIKGYLRPLSHEDLKNKGRKEKKSGEKKKCF